MSLEKLTTTLTNDLAQLRNEGRAKAPERVIVDYVAPAGEKGPRYKLSGSDQEFIRMNSNSYLSLSHHPGLLEAADRASLVFGAGPGAVRFIDGTSAPHTALEARIARFVDRPAARVFNSAYTSVLGLSIAITDPVAPPASMNSPTLKGRKTNSMTPAAKFDRVPWRASPTASPAAPSTATSDAV